MRIASWNLNHRVGYTLFQPDAANAAIALDVDAIFFNEYFPKTNGVEFEQKLADAGYSQQLISPASPEVANRTFLASRVPVEPDVLPLPSFDHQLPANLLVVRFPGANLRVIAVRVPWYQKPHTENFLHAWDWIE